jgi:hypothetical protein
LELFKWQLTTYGTLSCCTLNHFWWNILIFLINLINWHYCQSYN